MNITVIFTRQASVVLFCKFGKGLNRFSILSCAIEFIRAFQSVE